MCAVNFTMRHKITVKKVNTSANRNNSKAKGKAIPLQAWTGPEGFRRLRLPDFKTIDT
jgi:hypothetical protein